MMLLKDSGRRIEFASGAVRDIKKGKGRCDLLPLDILADIYNDVILEYINGYAQSGNKLNLVAAIRQFSETNYGNMYTAMLEVSKHYEMGAKKYGEHNWQKGIPIHSYIDSGVRHYLKWLRGDTDEPHDRAFIWNMLSALWTHKHLPNFCDLQFSKEKI